MATTVRSSSCSSFARFVDVCGVELIDELDVVTDAHRRVRDGFEGYEAVVQAHRARTEALGGPRW